MAIDPGMTWVRGNPVLELGTVCDSHDGLWHRQSTVLYLNLLWQDVVVSLTLRHNSHMEIMLQGHTMSIECHHSVCLCAWERDRAVSSKQIIDQLCHLMLLILSIPYERSKGILRYTPLSVWACVCVRVSERGDWHTAHDVSFTVMSVNAFFFVTLLIFRVCVWENE